MKSITQHLEEILDTLFVIKHRGFFIEYLCVLFLTIVCALAMSCMDVMFQIVQYSKMVVYAIFC